MTVNHGTPGISRRTTLAGLGMTSLGLALGASPATAQESSPESVAAHAIVGTWVLQFDDPAMAPVVGVFGADGSFIDAGSGHAGVWEATDPGTVLHTWAHVFAQANNYVVVSGTIDLDGSGDGWTQGYSSMVVTADGTVIATGGGTVQARRLHIVPEDEIGAPLSVVPTWTPAPPDDATPAG